MALSWIKSIRNTWRRAEKYDGSEDVSDEMLYVINRIIVGINDEEKQTVSANSFSIHLQKDGVILRFSETAYVEYMKEGKILDYDCSRPAVKISYKCATALVQKLGNLLLKNGRIVGPNGYAGK